MFNIKCSGYAWPLTSTDKTTKEYTTIFENQIIKQEEHDEFGRRILHNIQDDCQTQSQTTNTCNILSTARNYQIELVEHCKHENTILVAPTGAGKTFISALLIHHMLELNPLRRVLFIVNQISLVEQQTRALREFGIERVGAFHGEKKSIKNWKVETRDYSVLVCTIQIILNILQYSDIFDDLQLLVFDECHHTHSNHPFKVLMRDYYKPRKHAGLSVPRILGLSATPAAKNTIAETLLKLLQLGHDLDCTVRQVEKNEELSSFVFTPSMKVISVEMDPFSARLNDFIFNSIRGVKIKLLEKVSSDADVDIDDSKFGTDDADEWIDAKMNHISGKYDNEDDDRNLEEFLNLSDKQNSSLILICKTLSVLNESLMINDHRSCSAAWNHLLIFLNSLKDIDITKTLGLCGISQKSYEYELSFGTLPIHCNKRFELANLLREYREKGKELRALIFVKTRIGCKETMDFLKSLPDLQDYIKVNILLGHGKNGMTSIQQNAILDNFRNGTINILVSTSVTEEGLDVPNCSLVVRLDGIETTQTMIQSRGRARSANSEFYCIHHSNSALNHSFEKYQMQEQKMVLSINLLSKSETVHPDTYYRKLHLQSIGLKQMVMSHIFEYIWHSEPIYKVEETVLKLFEFTERSVTQSTVLTLTCEKLFGVKPIFQVIKVGHSFFARIIIKLNNYDRSKVDFGLQAAKYFILASSSMYKSKQEAKNAASLESLKKLLERDLAIFPSRTWTEIYKERYRHTIFVEDMDTTNADTKVTTPQSSHGPIAELSSKYKNSTIRIIDENMFKQKVTPPSALNCLFHHCKINYGPLPTFSEMVAESKNGFQVVCTVDKVGTVKGDPSKKKKEAKKDAVMKMCELIFSTFHYIDMAKSDFNKC